MINDKTNMKKRLLFEGERSDGALENVLPKLISKAIESGEDVFLRWNGATIRVEPKDTVGALMQKYDETFKALWPGKPWRKPVDGRDKHLYRIRNRLAEFYIVARSFDEAADEMKKRLDAADYGFASYRDVPSIDHMAVQHFNLNNSQQSFSGSVANLIIAGD